MNKFEKLQQSIDGIADNAMGNMTDEYKQALSESRDILQEYSDTYGTLELEVLRQNNVFIELENRLAEVVEKVRGQTENITKSMLRRTYSTSFDGTAEFINSIADDRFDGAISRERIKEVLDKKVGGKTLSERLNLNRDNALDDILSSVETGLREGKSYEEMSKVLQERYEVDINTSNRVVRTESHRVMEESKSDTVNQAAEQDIEVRKWWMTSQDERVRETHQDLGDKYSEDNAIPVDEPFVIDGMEAMHPGGFGVAAEDINCRCITAYTTQGGE